jgi:hypothetical protein
VVIPAPDPLARRRELDRPDRTREPGLKRARSLRRYHSTSFQISGHRQEDRFWRHTLGQLAAHFGAPDATVDTLVVCVDRTRQWSRFGNVWPSSAIRSTLYTAAAPLRWLRRSPRAGPDPGA